MNRYDFETMWLIESPVDDVWDAIVAGDRWPEWWPFLESTSEIAAGDSDGLGAVRRYTWRGPLLYKLAFEITVTKIEKPFLLEGTARGDLDGVGRWTLSEGDEKHTLVRYSWSVQTTRLWMNMIAPVAGRLFVWNHDQVMAAGRKGLTDYLDAQRTRREPHR